MKPCCALLALILAFAGCAHPKPATAPAAKPGATPATVPPAPTAAPSPGPTLGAPGSPGTVSATTPPRPRPPAPPPLVGLVSRADLEGYVTWKELRAQDYTPDAGSLAAIRKLGSGVEVVAIVATWCPDSKRDVPRFFKIADLAGFPLSAVKMVAVDRTKKDADGLTEKLAVTRVPTFVFFRDGNEVGRITERPIATLEVDMAAILGVRQP